MLKTKSQRSGQVEQFDAEAYITRYPDVVLTGLSPREHFELVGKDVGREGRYVREAPARPRSVVVSVVCITYEHSKFIAETLKGFIFQETDFPVEFLIADDASSDGNQDIIKQYAAIDPRIKPILRDKNLGVAENFRKTCEATTGKYVALCEGDDYWTDPLKLQKQVDYMNAHSDCTVLFHPVEVFHDDGSAPSHTFPSDLPPLTFWSLLQENFIQTNSVMYRWRFGSTLPDWFNITVLPLDWYVHLAHAEIGTIAYLPETMARYRKHDGGIWSIYRTPRELSRKHGLRQLQFYRVVGNFCGGLFEDVTRHIYETLLKDVLSDAMRELNDPLVSEIVNQHGDMLAQIGYTKRTPPAELSGIGARFLASQTRISVVVLTYNHSTYLPACLEGVLRQKGYFELEIIIGDDASTDGTLAIAERYRAENPDTIKIIRHAANVGMLTNMKECLAECTGEFIAFCEGDDYWVGDRKLARQLDVFRKRPNTVLCFNWVLLQREDDGSVLPHPGQSLLSDNVEMSRVAEDPITANFSCCMYEAKAVRQVPDAYFERSCNADWAFNMYVAERGEIRFLKEVCSVYRLHSKGQWTGLSDKVKEDQFARARRTLSRQIGLARGFDNMQVVVRKVQQLAIDDSYIAYHLDSPAEGIKLHLMQGGIRISGWIVEIRGRPIRVVVTRNGVDLDIDLKEVVRLDVLRAITAQSGSYVSPVCGFMGVVPFVDASEIYEINMEIAERRIPWIIIEAGLT